MTGRFRATVITYPCSWWTEVLWCHIGPTTIHLNTSLVPHEVFVAQCHTWFLPKRDFIGNWFHKYLMVPVLWIICQVTILFKIQLHHVDNSRYPWTEAFKRPITLKKKCQKITLSIDCRGGHYEHHVESCFTSTLRALNTQNQCARIQDNLTFWKIIFT
jgi:uncharacterized membrane protein